MSSGAIPLALGIKVVNRVINQQCNVVKVCFEMDFFILFCVPDQISSCGNILNGLDPTLTFE